MTRARVADATGIAILLGVALALAYAGKAVCLAGETGFWAETRYCYSDVRVLWSLRGFDAGAVPYAGPPAGYPVGYTLEYPPGLAFPAWLIALVSANRAAFFNLHALTFAVAAVVAVRRLGDALALLGRDRERLLRFVLSPALVLFGMQNWDLWPVALVALGLAAAVSGRPDAAGAWFGLGAAVKWWPALLAVPLLAGPWAAPRGSGAWRRVRPAVVAAGAWAAVQLPALAVSPARWWAAIAFHLERRPNADSVFAAFGTAGRALAPGGFWDEPYAAVASVLTALGLAAGVGVVAVRLRRGTLDPAAAALALVAVLLLTGKVLSPQFVLWLLPLAVLAPVRWRPVVAVEVTNAAVWLTLGPWLGDASRVGWLHVAQAITVLRHAALAWLLAAALSARQQDAEHEQGAADKPAR